jgi:hypothetical protein
MESENNAIRKIFSGIQKITEEPWASIWKERLIQYLFVFDVVSLAGIILLWIFRLAPTDHENALFFLSAMVTAQATIFSLVVTLTLIAIQMAAASYTPRVVDVMKKNPDMWLLLFIYLIAISFGFMAIKLVPPGKDSILASLVLILGIYSFAILFLYLKNTIELLRPDKVVKMQIAEINSKNIYEGKRWEDDIFQPVFDVVNASINRYDVTTTKTGLKNLSERLLEIFSFYEENSRSEKAGHITEYFCDHIRRSAIVAIRNNDEGILLEIIDILDKFGAQVADNKFEEAAGQVADLLGRIGTRAADNKLGRPTEHVADVLGRIGIRAADNKLGKTTGRVIDALKKVGLITADDKLKGATEHVADALGKVGIRAADDRLAVATRHLADTLGDVRIHAADNNLDCTI